MSYTVNFYRFAKKTNSTKQPTALPDETFTCDFMPGSSILAPTLRLNTSFLDPSNLTYADITALGRKYFVSNWRYDRGLWWCSLEEDILGTYKSSIGNFSMYVVRASSEMDGRIIDTKYPVKVGASFATEENLSNPFASKIEDGYFVVGIINGDAAAVGVTSYYVFTNAEFRAFSSFLMGNSSYLNSPSEISDELLKCLVNPTQYISSCIWLPFAPPMEATAISSINIGWWTVTASCHRLSNQMPRYATSLTINVPKHPDSATRGYYLLQEPYSSYFLDFPPFGDVSISANDLVDTTAIAFIITVDCITGKGRLDIEAGPVGNRGTINVVYAQVGVPVALAQNAPDLASVQQFAMQPANNNNENFFHISKTSGNTRLGKWLNEQIDEINSDIDFIGEQLKNSTTIANIGNALVASRMPMQVVGGNGGFLAGAYSIRLIATFATITNDNSAEWGRPLCQVKTLSTLSGFIQCADADFELSCTAPERAAIGAFLTSGFYME